MIKVTYLEHDGTAHEVEVPPGVSLMQAAVDAGLSGIVGECGGALSCASCHVYVPPEWARRLPAAGAMEAELVQGVLEPRANSRLSCQIVAEPALDGLVVQMPSRQF